MDTLGEREAIQRLIFKLRKSIDVQLAYGDAEAANRLRDEIGDLEGKMQLINERERAAERRLINEQKVRG